MFIPGFRIALAALAVGLSLSGCQRMANPGSLIFERPSATDGLVKFTPEQQQIIAENLVDALTQLPETEPLNTTIQIASPDTPFGFMLVDTLQSAGYGQQMVEGDIGQNLLRYLVENAETETGYRTRYKVEIGEISVERDYHLEDGQLLPKTGLRVTGSGAAALELNDGLFTIPEGRSIDSSVITLSTQAPVIRQLANDTQGLNSDLLSYRMQATNIRTRGENPDEPSNSKYGIIFERYDDIRKDILIFPYDSLRLSNRNKSIVLDIAKDFDPLSEIISVVGCSQGKTDIVDGNRYLAIGRASRVREALVLAGVDGASIFDEGCWDGANLDETMPSRGVVLSVKRARL